MRCLILIFFGFCPATLLVAQPNLKLWAEKASGQDSFSVHYDTRSPYDALVRFHAGKFREVTGFPDWLLASLKARTEVDGFRLKGNSTARGTKQYLYFRQTYKGIDVDLSSLNAMVIGNRVESFQLYQFPVPDSVPSLPAIDLTQALESAKRDCQMNSSYRADEIAAYPDTAYATLVVYPLEPENGVYRLAYRVYVTTPGHDGLFLLHIDAVSARVILKSQIKSYENCFKTRNLRAEESGSVDNTQETVPNTPATISPSGVSSTPRAVGLTRYSGKQQQVVTESANGLFRLRAPDYGDVLLGFSPDVITKDFKYNSYGRSEALDDININAAIDITDADNSWLEYADNSDSHKNPVLSGFEIHFNTQLLYDYWYNKHERNSWDGSGGDLVSFVNVQINQPNESGTLQVNDDNAVWNRRKKMMFYGNGHAPDRQSGINGLSPFVSLDASAHEIGHGVSQTHINQGNGFIPDPAGSSRREVDAIDESFSDIWAVCAGNYFNEVYVEHPKKSIWTIMGQIYAGNSFEQCDENVRFIPDPKIKCNPRVWQGENWDVGNESHKNSHVFSYWFYLIAHGASGFNEKTRFSYDISSIGFDKAERFVYELGKVLPGDVDYPRLRDRAVALAESLVGNDLDHYLTEMDLQQIRLAWAAVGLGLPIIYHNTDNAPFQTNEFNTVAVSKSGLVWAGTEAKGVYRYDGEAWLQSPTSVSGYQVTDIKADPIGNIWITQCGRGVNNFYAGGGVYKFPENSFSGFTYYNANDGISSRHPSGIFIKSDVTNNSLIGKVYVSQRFKPAFPDAAEPETVAGKISYLNAAGAFDNFIWNGASTLVTGYSCVGGNSTEVWAFNTSEKKIVRLKQDNTLLGVIGRDDIPGFPGNMGFFVNAIHFDAAGRKWLGFADSSGQSGGLAIQDVNGTWKFLPPGILPFPCTVRNNAITSDADGVVWVGTGQGLLRFSGVDPAAGSNYLLYKTEDGLPSLKINALSADRLRGGVWIATNSGICFLYSGGSDRITQVSASVKGICSDQLEIGFTAQGPFLSQPAPNQFIIEIADPDGSFPANPTPLGVLSNNASFEGISNFSASFSLPANYELPYGLSQIRIRSTNPPFSKSTYVNRSVNIMPSTPLAENETGLISATLECTRDGWTHYYYEPDNPSVIDGDEQLLLSIKKGTNDLGVFGQNFFVQAGRTENTGRFRTHQINAPVLTKPYIPMNRYWNVIADPNFQPLTPVLIRFYYSNADLADVNATATDKIVRHEDLVFYKTQGENCSPNPSLQFAGCSSIIPITPDVPGGPPFTDGLTWRHLDMGKNIHAAEYYVSRFSGGSGGHTVGGGVFTNSYVQSVKNGNWSDSTTWSTGMVPDRKSQVTISHSVQVDVPTAECLMLNVKPAGNVVVQGGAALKTFAQ